MKRTTTLLTLLLIFAAAMPLSAQRFLPPSSTFTGKKISYITLTDGTKIEGYIRSIDRKKGLIESVKLKDESGKKYEFEAGKIAFMYLPPSGFDKFSRDYDFMHDVTKWEKSDLDHKVIMDGYVYFEQASVQVRKKTLTLLVQLLNPSSCSKIRVYHDPYASETMAVGVAGFTVAGGDAKSYYVSVRGETANLLQKRDYDEAFGNMYGDCPAFVEAEKEKIKWLHLERHVFEYHQACP